MTAGHDTWAGLALIALASLAGSRIASRHGKRRELWLGAASGALLVIAGVHLLPDAWSGARAAGVATFWIPVLALTAFVGTDRLAHRGCNCSPEREVAVGVGTTAALAGHRILEGAALALSGSVTVLAALATHAFAEGLACTTMLTSLSRRRRTVWLATLCLSPVLGAALARIGQVPDRVAPVLLAVAAGVLVAAARVGLTAAFGALPDRRTSSIRVVAAVLGTGLVTSLAVSGLG